MEESNNRAARRAAGLVILSGALAGTTGTAGRLLAAGGMSSTEIGACRFTIAALLFLAACLRESPALLRFRLRDSWLFLGTGLLGQLMYSLLFFSSVAVTPLSVAQTLAMTFPFFVIFLSRLFFRETLTPRKLLSALIAFAGSASISGVFGGVTAPLGGALMALGAGLAYALYSVLCRAALERGYSAKTVGFYTWLFAALGSRCLWPADRPLLHMFSCWQNVAVCLFVGVAVGYIATQFFVKALPVIGTGKASILSYGSPIVSALLGFLVFGERITLWQALGMALIVCAVALLNGEKKPAAVGGK